MSLQPLGTQLLADLHGCSPEVLADVAAIREHMMEAARRAGATIVAECFHRFEPYGVSGVVVLAESHLAVHTWPERGFAAVDLFTCSDTLRPHEGFAYLCTALGAAHATTRTIPRGEHGAPPPGPAGG